MTPPKRGGKRPGSGRKPTGHTKLIRSMSLPPGDWERFDSERGKHPRGKFLVSLLNYWLARRP